MILVYEEGSAATAAGTALSEKNALDITPYPRYIKKVAVTGSSAAGNAAVDLYLGQTFIGTFYNTSTGTAPVEAKDYRMIGWTVDGGERVVVKIRTASTTNILHVEVVTEP